MHFTLVSTVFNEARRLDQTIDDLKKQTLQPSEIIITDAGSTDGTYEMLNKWAQNSPVPITILQKHKCNVAEGRNLAIKAAKYDIIASMDFGCRFLPGWLESIISPFNKPDVNVVGGQSTVDETEQLTIASRADFVASNGYATNVYSNKFIPSSRSIAYKKSVYNHIGGYCEWLTLAGDDTVFALEIYSKGYNVVYTNKPEAFWGRHKNLEGYTKEMYRYGLGNGEANIDFKKIKNYILQFLLRVIFLISFILLVLSSSIPLYILIGIMLLSAYSFLPYWGFFKRWLKFKSEKYNVGVLLFGFYMYERNNISYVKGYIKGYYFNTPFQKQQAALLKSRLMSSTVKPIM